MGCSQTKEDTPKKENTEVKKSIEEQAVVTTQDKQAKVGDWVATEKGYVRIDKVLRGKDAMSVVNKYNKAESTISKFTELEPELEYGVLEYSVYYSDKLTEKEIYPNVTMFTEGIGEDTYANRGYHYINTVYNITWYDEDTTTIPTGKVYKGCKAIFTTVADMSKITVSTDYIKDKVRQTNYIVID